MKQVQHYFNTLDSIFSSKKGFKSHQFLKVMHKRAKYGYLVFGQCNNLENFQNIFKKYCFKESDEKDFEVSFYSGISDESNRLET